MPQSAALLSVVPRPSALEDGGNENGARAARRGGRRDGLRLVPCRVPLGAPLPRHGRGLLRGRDAAGDGRATGDCYVTFSSPAEAQRALGMNHKNMGSRYVELFAASAPFGAYETHGSSAPGADFAGASAAGTAAPRPLLHAKTDQASCLPPPPTVHCCSAVACIPDKESRLNNFE